MAKKGILSVGASIHTSIGKKRPQKRMALWLCLFLLVALTIVAGCAGERDHISPERPYGTQRATAIDNQQGQIDNLIIRTETVEKNIGASL